MDYFGYGMGKCFVQEVFSCLSRVGSEFNYVLPFPRLLKHHFEPSRSGKHLYHSDFLNYHIASFLFESKR